MTATRSRLRGEYREAAHGLALTPIGAAYAVVGVLIVACITALIIWLVTATSAARGGAAVTRQHNSGSNQVAQNTKLLGDQATVLSDQQKIQILAANQHTEQDRMDLAGLQQNCAADVAAYNADVQNILAAGLLPAGLPSAYPTTICEVSK